MLTTDNNNGIYKQMDNKNGWRSNLIELSKSFIYSLLWVGVAYGIIKTEISNLQEQTKEVTSSLNSHLIDDVNRHEFNTYVNGVDKRFDALESKIDLIITLIDK